LPNDVRQRFHYNVAVASAYSAQQAVNHSTMAAAHRGEPIKVISHGAQIDIDQHLVLGNVTIVDLCRLVPPVQAALTESRANGEE
jgi:hypothetical protein